jgi:hypothetical protein
MVVTALWFGHHATNHPCSIVAWTRRPSVSFKVAAVTFEPA